MEDIREVVRQKYADAITRKTGCCGVTQCCDDTFSKVTDPITANLYDSEEVAGLPTDMIANSFGCGNPTALTEIHPGQVVLDLGSGAGLDVLLSARRVGPTGKAYGLDMTDEMLKIARDNQVNSGITNAEFLKGHIEDIPLLDNTVDVIISNCVINLSGDKDKVMAEAFRVLKPGGKFAVSDIVLRKPLPDKVQQDLLAWAGCVAGALLEDDYKQKLVSAGFEDIEVQVTRSYDLSSPEAEVMVGNLTAEERQQLSGAIVSAFVRATKP